MSDSNLPQVSSRPSAPVARTRSSLTEAGSRQGKLLLAGVILTGGCAIVMFVLTQHVIFSSILGALALAIFGTRQLVKKSLAQTAAPALDPAESPGFQLEAIRKQVSKCKFLEKVEREGTLASDQATQLVHQYKNLQNLLDQKFEPGELTRARYSEGIGTSCLAIGENLLLVKSLLENLNIGDPKAEGEQGRLWQEQLQKAGAVLAANSSALGELASLFDSLNQIVTKEKYRDQLEQSMQELRDLAARAKQYSKQ